MHGSFAQPGTSAARYVEPMDASRQGTAVSRLGAGLRIVGVTLSRFLDHDGWAIASHIALSALMSLFPFLIVVTAVAGMFGSLDLADEVAALMLQAWPAEVAGPITAEVRNVLTRSRSDALTLGAVAALYFSSSGIEALRIGLNRAYQAFEWRPWWLTRLESILYVVLGAGVMLVFAVLVVFAPLLWRTLVSYLPAIEPIRPLFTLVRLGVATVVIVLGLIAAHLWLASGRRRFRQILPGVVATLVLWVAGGAIFGFYLDSFAFAYVSTYAGLATAMVALVFLYTLAAIFIFGGELNAAIMAREEEEMQ
jgi:membrane protein